ncbi:hypothetical protein BDN72DRAFT_898639 [Pluteus cervinus]|uniref:Uncharacterized protein n=1 Tax=Pluteus cervinus TaxID=181527 RepID=A0ACD3APU1_9AGAR|nr:hypothetical protein BDN72DRAFT_898639 [Pluteus cervinus]
MYNIPEILWFMPTAEHVDDPYTDLSNVVPAARGVVKNLWYSDHGDTNDRRVVVFNWKTREEQAHFMGTADYVEWCFPFIEMANGKTVVGQYLGSLSTSTSLTIDPIFNAPSTDFLHFTSERSVPLIKDYVGLLAKCPDCVGWFWGRSVDKFNQFTLVLIVGWATTQPQHDGISGHLYQCLVYQAKLQSLRHLTYVAV